MVANRKTLIREITQIKNRFARWFAIYFPEYTEVFGDYEAQLDSVMEEIESLCKKIPESEQMLAIKGIGVIMVF